MKDAHDVLVNYLSSTLKDEAKEASKTITIKEEDGTEVKRESTPEESDIIGIAIYSALLVIRSHEGEESYQAAKDTAEFMADFLIPDLQGYLSVYIPIERIIEKLSKELADKENK